MRWLDLLGFAWGSLRGGRSRAWLMLLAMSIGVTSVVLLTALGEGARRYVVGQFEDLGTHLLIVLPGRSETTGGAPPLLGETPRDLTLDDALALYRSHAVLRVAPIALGGASVSHGSLEREVTVVGSTAELFPVRNLEVSRGHILPGGDPSRGTAVTVLGKKLKKELFGNARALGQWVRIADRRFRVIGILSESGESLGDDLGDMAFIPVASAQALFDSPSLFRILIQARDREALKKAERDTREIIKTRHDGEDDVTIIAQDALLSTFDDILSALTYAVGGIAGISLTVAGVLIMNVMLVSVSQRTREIGLLKAVGGSAHQIQRLFLAEALILATLGALAGLALSVAGLWGLNQAFPDFPISAPLWAPVAAVLVAMLAGLLFGWLPARRAAALDPVQALSGR